MLYKNNWISRQNFYQSLTDGAAVTVIGEGIGLIFTLVSRLSEPEQAGKSSLRSALDANKIAHVGTKVIQSETTKYAV